MNCFNNEFSNNIINLVRGDYLELIVKINISNDLNPSYINLTNSNYRDYKIFFGIMEPNQAFEDSIVYKIYTINDSFIQEGNNLTEDGSLIIKLYSEDTICLHPGEYFYSIKIQNPNNFQIQTVINNNKLNIL